MFILSFFIAVLSILFLPSKALAIYDPHSVPNNKIGIHLLFPDELSAASKIINREGDASWGYVTIPIQANDRDRKKWQSFLDKCNENKVIPIIRVATVPEGSSWVKPNDYDLVDFANFLNDLKWPIQNRYVIIFNEVNRADEYGGILSPENYADILSNSVDIFKSRSDNFFILPAGLDNAATDRRNSLNWKVYLQRMYRHRPEIFNKIDGWVSHAYANPAFSARPNLSGDSKIDSFKYDLQLLKSFTNKNLPVFITETGWSNEFLSDQQVALYYQYAFANVWSDPSIVAVTPFLLNAQDGPFEKFSFLDKDQKPKEFAEVLKVLAQNGAPNPSIASPSILIDETTIIEQAPPVEAPENKFDTLENIFKSFMKAMDQIK